MLYIVYIMSLKVSFVSINFLILKNIVGCVLSNFIDNVYFKCCIEWKYGENIEIFLKLVLEYYIFKEIGLMIRLYLISFN